MSPKKSNTSASIIGTLTPLINVTPLVFTFLILAPGERVVSNSEEGNPIPPNPVLLGFFPSFCFEKKKPLPHERAA